MDVKNCIEKKIDVSCRSLAKLRGRWSILFSLRNKTFLSLVNISDKFYLAVHFAPLNGHRARYVIARYCRCRWVPVHLPMVITLSPFHLYPRSIALW